MKLKWIIYSAGSIALVAIIIAILFFLGVLSPSKFAAPQKDLWSRWELFNPLSNKTIDYRPWQRFLNTYVIKNDKGINLVNYADVTREDKARLSKFINYLESIPIDDYNRNVQMAYWINLYNARTVLLILQHFPVNSILEIKPNNLLESGPWNMKVVHVENIPISLNDIEHRILRPIWNDPRIHFALNCASLGCPNLQKKAYTAATLNEQLNKGGFEYINNFRGAHVKDHKLTVSKIFVWYKSDFGGTDKGVIRFIKLYAYQPLLKKLKGIDTISNSEYDWGLNEFVDYKY